MDLLPFTAAHAARVAGWPTSADEVVRWCGRREFFMRVQPDNERALRCCRGAGFLPVDPSLAETWNEAQPVGYVWLQGDTEAPAGDSHAEPGCSS